MGAIINSSRIFARQIIANAEHDLHTGKATADEVETFKKNMIHRQIAFAHALRPQLRQQEHTHEYKQLLSETEYLEVISRQNPANHILLLQGKLIKEGIRTEILGGFDNISLEPSLATFNQYQGSCERIKNTPLLRQYHYFTRLFLIAFMIILPFSLISDFKKMGAPGLMTPVSLLISFIFGVIGKVGEVNEDPFENKIADLPLNAMCNTIERDLKEMIGETIPEKIGSENGFLM